MLRLILLTALMIACMGCQMIPDVSHQPVVHNPFPQLHKVAVAPFINLSDNEYVDGEQFGDAYFAELQSVPGFEVLPPNVVIAEMNRYGIHRLDSIENVRKLAQLLNVDAIVIGTVTDFTPYYPPRVGMKVEWHAANPCFHAIPPGYGLPWGTPEEEFIPSPLVFEAEFALARSQLKTQTPHYKPEPPAYLNQPGMMGPSRSGPSEPAPMRQSPSEPMPFPHGKDALPPQTETPNMKSSGGGSTGGRDKSSTEEGKMGHKTTSHEAAANSRGEVELAQAESIPPGMMEGSILPPELMGEMGQGLPPDWPTERAFIPPPPSVERPGCKPQDGPIMTHTKIYQGDDSLVTEALASYVFFRDDARQGGWQAYLKRSDDFIRFCCHMHIYEMLSARGGGGETRVVWRWLDSR